jgi:hypothetical protein
MEYYLRKLCSECGGDVMILTTIERNSYTHKKEIVVSHGTCIYCMESQVFPNEELGSFLSKFKKDDYYSI